MITKRLALHLIVGFVATFASIYSWVLTAGILFIFWFYESNEDWYIKDQAWKDVVGCLVGMLIASPVVVVLHLTHTLI